MSKAPIANSLSKMTSSHAPFPLRVAGFTRRTHVAGFTSRPDRAREGRGTTLVELMAALVVLGAMFALTFQALAAFSRQQREAERRAFALETAASALEELTALSFEAITPDAAEKLTFARQAADTLPGGTVTCEVDRAAGPLEAKRVVVRVGWNSQGRHPQSASLTTWVYSQARSAP